MPPKAATDVELQKLVAAVGAQGHAGLQHGKQLEALRSRADVAAAAAAGLGLAFHSAEATREQWQQRQGGAQRLFREQLDAHLQQLEELLTEKVDASRVDVVRLGRSNVALASLVHQCRSRVQQLASAEEAAAEWRARLEAHAEVTRTRRGWRPFISLAILSLTRALSFFYVLFQNPVCCLANPACMLNSCALFFPPSLCRGVACK